MECFMKATLPLILVTVIICAAGRLYAADSQKNNETTQNKNVTIIHGESTADGKSEMKEQVLEECIVSLPSAGDLEPQVASQSQYLREINGDPAKNEFQKYYTATIEINYMLYQKVLIVVTTNSVAGQEPVMKVMEKNVKQTKRFVSDPSEGDIYAGKSHRQYYFSTPEAASVDVKKRAQIWLKELAAVICKKQP
jgi:hypothetical protein